MENKYGVWAVRSAASVLGAAESWCKNDGVPMAFDALDDARQYANHLNDRVASQNVHYYVKEIDPAELVAIRSAVHSNYAGMVAMVGADNKVYLGKEESYHYGQGYPAYYDNRDNSLCFVTDRTDMYYFLYGEGWVHTQADMLERGLTPEQYAEFARLREGVLQQFTPRRELLFAGKPFQPSENYLRNAELDMEAEKGNYNMIDGIVNNEPAPRADLTDGQTHEEIRELAPETLPEERPSIMERLKTDRPERGARQIISDLPEREL